MRKGTDWILCTERERKCACVGRQSLERILRHSGSKHQAKGLIPSSRGMGSTRSRLHFAGDAPARPRNRVEADGHFPGRPAPLPRATTSSTTTRCQQAINALPNAVGQNIRPVPCSSAHQFSPCLGAAPSSWVFGSHMCICLSDDNKLLVKA